MILNGRYYLTEYESGVRYEVSKEYYERYNAWILRMYKEARPNIEEIKGLVQIYGTGGDLDGDNDWYEMFVNPDIRSKPDLESSIKYFIPHGIDSIKYERMKILILGHANHGKDTLAGIISELFGYSFKSSSVAATEIFLYDALRDKYGYKTTGECFEDRINHRAEWHDLICEYNTPDKAKLAREILKQNDMYVGMRSHEEIVECHNQHLFDLVLGIFDPRKPLESVDSFSIDVFEESDIVVPNAKSIDHLREKVKTLEPLIKNKIWR